MCFVPNVGNHNFLVGNQLLTFSFGYFYKTNGVRKLLNFIPKPGENLEKETTCCMEAQCVLFYMRNISKQSLTCNYLTIIVKCLREICFNVFPVYSIRKNKYDYDTFEKYLSTAAIVKNDSLTTVVKI